MPESNPFFEICPNCKGLGKVPGSFNSTSQMFCVLGCNNCWGSGIVLTDQGEALKSALMEFRSRGIFK